MKKISLAIVDDHAAFREGLVSLFEKIEDIKVLFEARNGVDLFEKLKSNLPEVVLLDLDMDEMNGEETYDLIVHKFPEIRVIILSGHCNESFVVKFVKKRVSSILSKTTPIKKIVEAIKGVHANGAFYDEFASRAMARNISDLAQGSGNKSKVDFDFNYQELQVLKLMCTGHSTKEISEKLYRSERTIDYNRNCIWKKTAISSKGISELMLFAIDHKLLTVM